MTSQTIHFTFGPVQEFVAQARRTRDFWGGSYIISWLAGHAMNEVLNLGGSVDFPKTDGDPLLNAIQNPSVIQKEDQAAQIGSLPNRFRASLPTHIDPKKITECLQLKWRDIADQIGGKIQTCGLTLSEDLWNQQIESTWDCQWIVGENTYLLDARKNFRTHFPQAEKGEKCTVCGVREEISALGRKTDKKSRQEMRDWWEELRHAHEKPDKPLGSGSSRFDLRKGERLCAICATKRFFPLVAKEKKAIGWEVPIGFPSTSYMAAVDWIIRVLKACKDKNGAEVKKEVSHFVKTAIEAGVERSEQFTRIKEVSQALRDSGLDSAVYTFADLDGGVFFESTLQNPSGFPLKGDPEEDTSKITEHTPLRQELIRAHKAIRNVLPEEKGKSDAATPFYAILFMDGDSMGSILNDYPDQQSRVSDVLTEFTGSVHKIVSAHNGRLIYAGGEDVFAILPLDKAIRCAVNCKKSYQEIFAGVVAIPEVKRTISAAVVFAHIHTPFGVVISDAFRLLKEVAKDKTGRDSIACRVWKRGGPLLTWSLPWNCFLIKNSKTDETLLDLVKKQFEGLDGDTTQFSSKFFYKLNNMFEILNSVNEPKLTPKEKIDLLVAEYISNRNIIWPKNISGEDMKEAEKLEISRGRMQSLVNLCTPKKRRLISSHNGKVKEQIEDEQLSGDGAMLVRFLSQKEAAI